MRELGVASLFLVGCSGAIAPEPLPEGQADAQASAIELGDGEAKIADPDCGTDRTCVFLASSGDAVCGGMACGWSNGDAGGCASSETCETVTVGACQGQPIGSACAGTSVAYQACVAEASDAARPAGH